MGNIIIGIDVSAKTLDICIKRDGVFEHVEIKNSIAQVKKLLKPFLDIPERVLIGMENTGKYNNNLYAVLGGSSFKAFVVHPYHLKKSIGLARGKNDKVDADRIVSFVAKNHEELIPWEPCSQRISQLKVLFAERKAAVKSCTRLKQKRIDCGYLTDKKLRDRLLRINQKNLKYAQEHVKEIEKMIREVVQEDDPIKQQMALLKSIPGVGDVVATAIIAKTEGFRLYSDPRKLACCAGVVPFRYQSGTSMNSKPRVSQMADKSLKTLLNMAALAAVKKDNDLKKYYDRKVAEGKNKMSVLNAVRNKIVHLCYAVIKNETFYENRLQVS